MAKLIITLDGAQVGEIPVDKERVTIGRRADNDIQLDHIAVSGQHAAVVTILNDAFLEDLGSTNGTVVNGAAVRKHFLRNGDLIEIGRHRLRFVGDQVAPREAADFEKTMVINRPISSARSAPAAAGPGEAMPAAPAATPARVASAPGNPSAELSRPATPANAEVGGAIMALMQSKAALQSHFSAEAPMADDSAEILTDVVAEDAPSETLVEVERLPQPVADALSAQARLEPAETALVTPVVAAAAVAAKPVVPAAVVAAPAMAVPQASAAMAAPARAEAQPHPTAPWATHAMPTGVPAQHTARLQILNGPAAGRVLDISKALTTVGRPGVQVAVISRRSDGFYIAQVDGEQPARLSGHPLPAHAVHLNAHDVLEIAGIKLEFFFDPQSSH